MKHLLGLLSLFLSLFALNPWVPVVYAEIQIDISGNGSSTSNNIEVTNSQTTEVSQTNTAEITNNVTEETNTGANEASGNVSANSQITTGDTSNTTEITNNVNNSVIATDCCDPNQIIEVKNNGADSQSSIQSQINSVTDIKINQLASIVNNLNVNSNTGENHANDNTGNSVIIQTGNINSSQNIANLLNFDFVRTGLGGADANIIIKNNGASSSNNISLSFLNNLSHIRNDIAEINNQIYLDLNTGKNNAFGNLNDVLVNTGDISSTIEVVNGPINVGGIDVLCCDDGTPVPGDGGNQEVPKAPPPQTGGAPTNGSSSNGNGNGNGNSSSKAIAENISGILSSVLPATGASALHFWIWAVIYLLMFLSGLYVRLRAGRSPDEKFAYANVN